MNIQCGKDYIGHRWGKPSIFLEGVRFLCMRCPAFIPRERKKETNSDSILNGLPIPERLVVQADE